MKSVKRIITLAILIFVMVACESTNESSTDSSNESGNSANNSGETFTLKFATSLPATAPFSEDAVEPFMERVTELTDGEVEWDYFPGEQLGKLQDYVDQTRNGVTDVAYYLGPAFPSEMPISSTLVGLPGLHESGVEGTVVWNRISKQSPILEEDFLPNGVRPIFGFVSQSYDLFTTGEEIKTPDDLEGLRVMSSGGVDSEIIEYLGGTPVTLSPTEMFEAFDKGIVDVLSSYTTPLKSYGVADLIQHGTNGAQFGAGTAGFIINEDVWQSFPDNVKDAFDQASEEIALSSIIANEEDAQKVYEEWDDQGKMYTLTEEEQKDWEEEYENFKEEWLEQQDNPKYQEAYDLFLEELHKEQNENENN
ncbi:TRAP transporter substrate-binding protein DctP [Alteribacillus sp. YIM 98480]|uniref:TRAP transporter substrate-binding protein DctP n=1 Tax=Alteribacillus sp. YIM 98480 TaxID=2606599 RepID=UPI00131C7E08|nr:TRAP transporter substrate-binding protein DctP [Alteribacillus sp. YIM 98480]